MSYSTTEIAVLVAIMAMGGDVPNAELKKRYGIHFRKQARERLNRDGLIQSYRPGGRRISHELTDRGWAFIKQQLAASPPKGAGTAGGALFALMNAMQGVLTRNKLSLAELMTEPLLSPIPHTPDAPRPLPEQILSAYHSLARRQHDWVPLCALRPLLSGSRSEVDSALLQLHADKIINLTLEVDQKKLAPADHDAAVRLGPNPMHLMTVR